MTVSVIRYVGNDETGEVRKELSLEPDGKGAVLTIRELRLGVEPGSEWKLQAEVSIPLRSDDLKKLRRSVHL